MLALERSDREMLVGFPEPADIPDLVMAWHSTVQTPNRLFRDLSLVFSKQKDLIMTQF